MIKKLMALSLVFGFSFSGLWAADDLESLDSPERAPARSMITADFISIEDGDIRLTGGDILVSNITCRNLFVRTFGTCRFSGRVEAEGTITVDAREIINVGHLSSGQSSMRFYPQFKSGQNAYGQSGKLYGRRLNLSAEQFLLPTTTSPSWPSALPSMISLDFISLYSQAAISLVQNEGNISPAVQSLANSEIFKSF